MKVNLEQLQIGVINYIDNEIGRKAVGLQKVGTYFVIAAYRDKIVQLVQGLQKNPMVQVLQVFDENGNLDLDRLYNYGKEAIQKSGQFSFMGIIFNETDIDKLYDYIKRTAI